MNMGLRDKLTQHKKETYRASKQGWVLDTSFFKNNNKWKKLAQIRYSYNAWNDPYELVKVDYFIGVLQGEGM